MISFETLLEEVKPKITEKYGFDFRQNSIEYTRRFLGLSEF